MNCFEFRRLLLASPRVRTRDQKQHLAQCAACATLARGMEGFESRVHDALRVPVPEALADRVLLRHKIRVPAIRAWAIAASLLAAIGTGVYFYRSSGLEEEQVLAAASLSAGHPAVAAINYVVDHEPQLLKEGRSGDPAVMRSALSKLGLKLPANHVKVRYLGKCPVPGGTGEHVVLEAPVGRVTLILVPEQPFASRVIVIDRDKTAVASPARGGGYILVADSLNNARHVEKLLM